MKLTKLSTLILTALLAATVLGCKKKMDRVTPLPGYGAGSTIRDPGLGSGLTPGTAPGGTGVIPAEGIPQPGTRSPEGRPQDRDKFRQQTVYFDFDRHVVKAGEAPKVQEVATKFLAESPATDLLIEGHCDERGTEEYNRALGERRALALREMLVTLGVPAERIHTATFGEDRPAEAAHDESAWSKNRRGEFILVLPR
jgi:peptidoglycan-associated lipoprotein